MDDTVLLERTAPAQALRARSPGAGRAGYKPADDAPRGGIDDDDDVNEVLPAGDAGDVRLPPAA